MLLSLDLSRIGMNSFMGCKQLIGLKETIEDRHVYWK